MGRLPNTLVVIITSLIFVLLLSILQTYFPAKIDINSLIASSSSNVYDEEFSSTQINKIVAAISGHDGRAAIVDKFLAKYRSPMVGSGRAFVAAADKYGLDWRLLPAIAFQESNLGKKIPEGSYNPFGWAVYTGKNSGAVFSDWNAAIFTVAKGLKQNYISLGLTSPETIFLKYADSKSENWILGVKSAIAELSSLQN